MARVLTSAEAEKLNNRLNILIAISLFSRVPTAQRKDVEPSEMK